MNVSTGSDAHLVDDAPEPGGVVRHLVHHLAVGVLEEKLFLKKSTWP